MSDTISAPPTRDALGAVLRRLPGQVFAVIDGAHFDDLPKVEASVFDDNPASARVLQKLGFTRVGDGDCQSLGRVETCPSSLYRVDLSQLDRTT